MKLVLVILAGAIVGVVVFFKYVSPPPSRQEMIHEQGSSVMPFDLNQTTHIFKKTDSGGIQQVVVKDRTADAGQIPVIRMHLQMEASYFQQGNFSDPMALHGDSMPGVEELAHAAGKIKITYSDLENGAQITYETEDAAVVKAIHQWFDAQVSDHGADAIGQ